MAVKLVGSVSGNTAEVNISNQLKIIPETSAITNPGNIGGVRVFGENDEGAITGIPKLASLEIDVDYRARVSQDVILDDETFNYTAQNTGKHSYLTTTLTDTWTAGQLTTNATSITTINTGTVFATYADFPIVGTTTLSTDTVIGFSAQPQSNSIIEFGGGQPSTALVAPADGVFFRLNSAGLQGIASFNGAEVSTGVFPLANGTGTWVYTNSKRYQFITYQTATEAVFWVNDGTGAVRLGGIQLPSGQSRMSLGSTVKYFIKHRIVGGAAGGILQSTTGGYGVRVGGTNLSTTPAISGSRIMGSYQGLSGGTMGSLTGGTVTTGTLVNPTAAVPTNTTAALGTGLGGQFWETVSLALNVDGIISSFQVPASTVNIQGKRLVIRGVSLASHVQTVIVGGPYVSQYLLAFGHTAVSLQTAEGVATKAPRRILLPQFNQLLTAAQAVSTTVSQPGGAFFDFGDAPVFVNPGEFVQLVTKHVGTVGTSGTVAHSVAFVYGWE